MSEQSPRPPAGLDEGPAVIAAMSDAALPPAVLEPEVDPGDVEDGRGGLPAGFAAWLAQVNGIDAALLSAYMRDPRGLIERARAEAAAAIVPPDRPASRAGRFWQGTTLYTDLIASKDFRAQLQRLEIDLGTAENPEPRNLLATMRDALQQLQDLVTGVLESDDPDVLFAKEQIKAQAQQTISDLGSIAYDRPLKERVLPIMGNVASLATAAMPFAYASYTKPASWFYTGALAGAYARTLAQMGGLVFNPALSIRLVKNNFRDRHLIWFLPAVFYAAQTFLKAASDDRPDNAPLQGHADQAIAVNESVWWPAVVGVAEFGLFLYANFPDEYQKFKDWTALKFAGATGRSDPATLGDIRRWLTEKAIRRDRLHGGTVQLPDGQVDDGRQRYDLAELIQNDFKLASGLWSVVRAARETYEMGGRIGDAESQLLDEVGSGLQRMGQMLEPLVENILGHVKLIDDDEKRVKKITGIGLLVTSATVGAVNSLGAIRIPALLSDYIPYYLTAFLVILGKLHDNSQGVDSVIRTFGLYNGGSLLGVPPSVVNLAFEFAFNEGAFDLVASELPVGLPANATHTTTVPSRQITRHPELHPGDGAVGFGLLAAYQILTVMLASGRMGEVVALSTTRLLHLLGKNPRALTAAPGNEAEDGAAPLSPQDIARLEAALIRFKQAFDGRLAEERPGAGIEELPADVEEQDLAAPDPTQSLGLRPVGHPVEEAQGLSVAEDEPAMAPRPSPA
ncbi:hypothetical protein SAMN07250955_110105 [Arboricoccus pini]|uniref:Uncharacterized protein n=1 Tax=Arboricoccus pini TaxID=1963835 RepID=A0A212RLF1_9PROT|nr:hypothetical protein [Arboricoccus pini]SNB73294.1 hypothetical protein SAMN07250955_110105 [Arboricoccus pini]